MAVTTSQRMQRTPKTVSPNVAPYSPTPLYGDCENLDCSAHARTTCPSCGGEYCRTHAEHAHRGDPSDRDA